MNKVNFLLIFCFSIISADNIHYLKSKIKHKSKINDGYSQNKKIKYQYISGKQDVYSNKINIAGIQNRNKNKKIINNTYGNNITVQGRNGFVSRYKNNSKIGTVDLNTKKNRKVEKVETYIDNLKIRKRR